MEQGNPLLTEVNKLTDLITQRGRAGENFNAFLKEKRSGRILTTEQCYGELQGQRGYP